MKDHVTCNGCKEPVHIHMFWIGKDGKKYHFNCLKDDNKTEAQLEVKSDNGPLLLSVLNVADKHGADVAGEAMEMLSNINHGEHAHA